MVTSETYTFAPSLGEVVLNSFSRIEIRRTALTQEHMQNARLESNLLLAEFSNNQPNLWTVDTIEVPLEEGVATYEVPTNTVMILDATIRTGTGVSQNDRILYPVGRTEYAAFPNKNEEGFPTVFWFDRLIAPEFTLWEVPDRDDYYTMRYYRVRQVQDAKYINGQNIEIPYLWLDAFCAGLAARLARHHARPLLQDAIAERDRTWKIAAKQNVENTPLYVYPALGSYYR